MSGDRVVVLGENSSLLGLLGPGVGQLGLWDKTPEDWGHPIQCPWDGSLGITYYHASPYIPGTRCTAKAQMPLQLQPLADGQEVSDHHFSQDHMCDRVDLV